MGSHLRSLLARRRREGAETARPGDPCSYLTLEAGTTVVDRFGAAVGHVERVLTNDASPYFDGIIISTDSGSRFVDAPEVRSIRTDQVELSVTCSDVEQRGPRTHGVYGVRIDRVEPSERDRLAAIERLKQAYVNDDLGAHELGDRIEAAYTATTLDELEALLCP